MEGQIQVVKRETIPPIRSVDQQGHVHGLGELRDFRWSAELRQFMPDASEFSVSWVRLEHEEVLHPHTHPIQSMLVVYAGSGRMLGDLCQPISEGDVIVVPPGRMHGFVGGLEGLHALSIQFGEGLYTTPEKPRVIFTDANGSLSALLLYSEKRQQEFSRSSLFEMLEDGTLRQPSRRAMFVECVRIWDAERNKLLMCRQATTMDPTYERAFLADLRSKLGDRADLGEAVDVRDATLQSLASWFSYQMYVLDNVEKAALVHLVVEKAAAVLDEATERALGDVSCRPASRSSSPSDGRDLELLRNETDATYTRLRRLVSEAWDMVFALTERIVDRTRAAY